MLCCAGAKGTIVPDTGVARRPNVKSCSGDPACGSADDTREVVGAAAY